MLQTKIKSTIPDADKDKDCVLNSLVVYAGHLVLKCGKVRGSEHVVRWTDD